ncbi:MAG: PorT family protein [Chitinophagaceae bacterium]|nr:PorT family protein [Chitinophagaceae bacterium]
MRKIYILTTILLTVGVLQLNAQVKFGVSAGINHSTWKGDAVGSLNDLAELTNGIVTTHPRNSFYAGGFMEMPLGEKISLQPGVYYSQKGYALKGNLVSDKFDFLGVNAKAELQSHYIDVPLVIKAEIAKGFQVYAGPQLSYLVKNNLHMDAGLLGFSVVNTNMDVTEQFNRADIALTGGASYTFDNGFFINAGYDHGLSRLDKNSNFKSFNRTVKAGIGFRF